MADAFFLYYFIHSVFTVSGDAEFHDFVFRHVDYLLHRGDIECLMWFGLFAGFGSYSLFPYPGTYITVGLEGFV